MKYDIIQVKFDQKNIFANSLENTKTQEASTS